MATVTAKVEFKETLRALNTFTTKQMPFAIKSAIDRTAFDVRRQWIGTTYRKAFTVRNKQFPRVAFRVEKANKRSRVITAYVYDHTERAFLPIHVKGGIRTPARSTTLAIPTRNVRRTAKGVSTAAKYTRNTFKANIKGRGDAVYQVYGPKKRRRLRLMFVLKPRARVPQSFDVIRDTRHVVRTRFDDNMRRALNYAIRTAR